MPEFLRPLFWDVDFDTLRWEQYQDFIVQRVLQVGNWEAVCWLRDANLAFVTAQTAPGTLHGHILGVRLSLFEFRYPLLQGLVTWEEIGLQLASLDNCEKGLAFVGERDRRKFPGII